MFRIGLAGVGHLGKHHLRILQDLPELEFTGCFDIDPGVQKREREKGVVVYHTFQEMLGEVDGIDIVVPTKDHHSLALQALQAGKHIFVEKPIARTLDEARDIVELATDRDLIVQVGHIERFNPAILALKDFPLDPRFIESHRLSQFQPRGTDVAVVLDLMIHDIDIIQSLVKSPVSEVAASGVAVVTDSIDIANARLTFENGCVANITASRISQKSMRKLRIFQQAAYISVDFHNNTTEIYQLREPGQHNEGAIPVILGEMQYQNEKKHIIYEQLPVPEINALQEELRAFAQAVNKQQSPAVSGSEGLRALEVAQLIQQKIQESSVSTE